MKLHQADLEPEPGLSHVGKIFATLCTCSRPPPHAKGYWQRSGSKWVGARTWTKWDGSKHSEVSSGSQGNKPSRPTAPVQRSMCVNNLFQLCAAAVHTVPESFLYLHKKLSSIVYSHPVKRFRDMKTHQSFYSNLEVALSSMNLSLAWYLSEKSNQKCLQKFDDDYMKGFTLWNEAPIIDMIIISQVLNIKLTNPKAKFVLSLYNLV